MITYIGIVSAVLTIASVIDKWLSNDAKEKLVSLISKNKFSSFDLLAKAINELFLKIFDKIYKFSNSSINRNIYRSVIFCYVFFFVMKLFIAVFNLKVPPTEYILLTVIIISTYTVLIYKSFTGILPDIVELRNQSDRRHLFKILKKKSFLVNFILYALCFAIFTSIIMVFSDYFGSNIKTLLIFSLWTVIIVFLSIFIVIIPVKYFTISPLRSFISSIIGLCLVLFIFLLNNNWDFYKLLLPKNSLILILSYITFNLFGDLISFQETRWILKISQELRLKYFAFLLILDVILSSIIFLILPVLSDVSVYELIQSLIFKGSSPWMGILFWTTFMTSILYYLYFIIIIITRRLFPFYRLVDRWFNIYKNPVRFFSFTLIILYSFINVIVAIF